MPITDAARHEQHKEDTDHTTVSEKKEGFKAPDTHLGNERDNAPGLSAPARPTDRAYAILGQIYGTYIILNTVRGCAFIDQHAAHEAMLYKMLRKSCTTQPVTLLFSLPVVLDGFSAQGYEWLMVHLAALHILARITPTGSCEVYAKPAALTAEQVQTVCMTLGEQYLRDDEGDLSSADILHDSIALMACKQAVKAGDTLSTAEMQALVDRLFAHTDVIACPHGRPVMWYITKEDLDRTFKRT
jgi:DNA mismatch repair protein MutL